MNMPSSQPQVVLSPERESSLVTIGHISYLLHTIVAVTAVLPGTQAATARCCAALQAPPVRGRSPSL
jgi:hypothetical protein